MVKGAGGGAGGGGGEVNTASNVGTGDGWFKGKVALDLEFKTIIGETNKVVIANNVNDLTVTLGNLVVTTDKDNDFGAHFFDLDNLVTPANPTAGTRRVFVDSVTGELSVRTSAATTVSLEAGGGGEANTASNVGTGAGWFKQKVVADLEFKTILGETNKVVVTSNVNDLTVTLGTNVLVIDASKTMNAGTKLTMAAAAAGGAGFRLLTGVDPTVPVQGDLWLVGDDLKIRGAATTRIFVDTARAQTLGLKTLDSTCIIQAGAYDANSIDLTTDVTGLLPNGNLANLPALGTLPASPRQTAIVTAEISDDQVTFAKTQNIATDRILGRETALSGDIEELTLNVTLELTATSIRRAALTGDITAPAGSNATTLAANVVGDAEIVAHTSTKITIIAKGQLNASIVYENEANTWGAFNQNIASGGKWQEAGKSISPIGLHDIYLAAGTFDEVTSNAIAVRTVDAGADRKVLRFMSFLNGAVQFGTSMQQLPRNYDNGTITAIIHWTSQVEGAGTVEFDISAAALGDGQDYSTVVFGTPITVTDTQTTINQEQLTPRSAAITIGNTPADNKMIVLKVQRDGVTDTFPQPVQFLGITIEISIDEAVAP